MKIVTIMTTKGNKMHCRTHTLYKAANNSTVPAAQLNTVLVAYLYEVVDALLDKAQELLHVAIIHARRQQLLVRRRLVLRHLHEKAAKNKKITCISMRIKRTHSTNRGI